MDRINNNSYFFNLNRNKESQKVLDKDTRMNVFIPKVQEYFEDMVTKQVPENGSFKKVFVTLGLLESQNEGLLCVEESSKDAKTLRNLLVGVKHKDRDRLISVYLKQNCSKEEIIKYLKDKSNAEELKKILYDLSAKTDDYYSSL